MQLKRIHIHILLWAFMLLFVFDYHWFEVSWITALGHSLIEVISYAILFYGTQFLYRRFKDQLFLFIVALLFMVAIYIIIIRFTGLEFFFYEAEGWRNIFSMVLNAILFCGLAILFEIKENRDAIQQKNLELDAKNKELQLHILKGKINPHFIFNTLNNLTALIVKKDEHVPDFINEFSTLLRYSIDEEGTKDISLEKEVECIKSYFALLEMQQPLAQDIDFYVEGELKGKKISPFIITSLVENAIKHSDIQYNDDGHLHFHLSCEEERIQVRISNSFQTQEKRNKSQGLNLIRSKLDLQYPDEYQLDIEQNDSVYQCRLSIHSPKVVAV